MGVMNCARSGCNNIMCDTYVESVGYVCSDCQEEFKNSTLAGLVFNESDITERLKIFMTIPKGTYSDSREIINEYFKLRTH